jgi:hypothetical protein
MCFYHSFVLDNGSRNRKSLWRAAGFTHQHYIPRNPGTKIHCEWHEFHLKHAKTHGSFRRVPEKLVNPIVELLR